MEFRQLFIGIMMVAAITIGIFMFATNLQSNYNVNNSLANDSKMQFANQLTNNVSYLFNKSNASSSAFYSSTPGVDSGGLMMITIVSSGRIISESITLVFNIIIEGEVSILGIPYIFAMILNGTIIVILILAIWSLIRLGR